MSPVESIAHINKRGIGTNSVERFDAKGDIQAEICKMRLLFLLIRPEHVILCGLLLLLNATPVLSQRHGNVQGLVTDSLTARPLPYSTVSIFSTADKKLVTGNVTNDAGSFDIDVSAGSYYAEISYIGYNTLRTRTFEAKPGETVSLGRITISPTQEVLEEVTVQAEKSSMELLLDKKVFNVGKDLANSGGTASDILTNIPSVAVDAEGNVKLRGSDNVRILIDGKPSGLVSFKGGSGLQQLQASMIERVEVITNPSARYEAEGLGGIINIVLKKEQSEGFNGSDDVISGYPNNF